MERLKSPRFNPYEFVNTVANTAMNVGKCALYEFKGATSIMKADGEQSRREQIKQIRENFDGRRT